jgi:Protein of unknown function (DUF2911)
MKKYVLSTVLIAAGVVTGTRIATAQSALLNLPRASQHARISQRIGITDITIDYHRPIVNMRKIFGRFQAYGQVWRAGANENTTFEVSDQVNIEGHPLQKGVYGLHMIPDPKSWIIIFSKNSTAWGSFTYRPSEDALRVTVVPQTIANNEVLRYDFDDPTLVSAVIAMTWEKVRVAFKVEVNTPEIVSQSLRSQLRSRIQFEWQPWMEAANYLLDNNLSPEEAATYADLSIQNEDRFENEITKARALGVLGRKQEALVAHDKALQLGSQLQIQVFARGLQAQGRKEEALELFRVNIKKDPNTSIAHNESARLAAAKGDFDTAVKEMKLALVGVPSTLKSQVEDLIRLLENKVDINY